MIELMQPLLKGDHRALARLLTYVENEREGIEQTLAALFPHTGNAWVVGITGAPGTGKSTLVNALAKAYRAQNKTVGILTVDPTSPFTGGAILGDRIRMRDLSGDQGVFIRSMATRGNLGGLTRATRDAIRLLDAASFDVILVETVGAGQSEVDIVRAAYTTLVVEAPGLGDDVQAIKAGILEIADIFVVNKADRPGAKNTMRSLRAMLELGHPASRSQLLAHHGRMMEVVNTPNGHNDSPWLPPIIETVAIDETGITELIASIESHRQHLTDARLLEALQRQQIELELHDRLRDALMVKLLNDIPDDLLSSVIERVQMRELDPQQAIREIIEAGEYG
jgi:LAO/AO transport system kinase